MRSFLIPAILVVALGSCNNNESKPAQPGAAVESRGVKEESINYASDSSNYNAFLAYPDSTGVPKPAIIVVPEWWGLNDYVKGRARQLADLGYVAMAIDMYGNGKQADNPKDAGTLAGAFYGNPQLGESRIEAAINRLKSLPQVDSTRIAAIGYCFGGSMVLNAARLGADLRGVVSFHGILTPAPLPDKNRMKAQVLVCHGGADHFTPAKDSIAFRKQMDSVGASYEFKTYPDSRHAFTNPKADEFRERFKDQGLDIGYNEAADKKSWEDMKAFLARIFR